MNNRKIVDPVEYDTRVSEVNKGFVRDFLIEKKSAGMSAQTIKIYENNMRIILTMIYRHFDNKSLIKLSKKEIIRLSILFQDRGLSTARVAGLLSTLRSCLEVLANDDEIEEYNWNIGSKVKSPKIVPVREITFLRDDQIEYVKHRLVSEGRLLQAVYFMLSYVSSKRKGEIHQVLKYGLTEQFYTNTVVGKGNKRFKIFYDQEVQDLIKMYLDERGYDEIPELFVKVYKNGKKQLVNKQTYNEWTTYFSKILSEYEYKEVYFTPHSLRHSRIDNLERSGVPLKKIQSLAAHSSLSMTERYLSDRGEEDIAAIFGYERMDIAQ